MTALTDAQTIGVIGAGTMGGGIAQLAASAGHRVMLFDAMAGAARSGLTRVARGLDALVGRGRMARDDADALIGRIVVVDALAELREAALVIEAIVENLEIKRRVFAELEGIVPPESILATNTSSISITSIARDLRQPERLVGMHFFNPAPVMKLVEVVSGIATAPQVAETIFATAKAWGKIPVHAKSTPGFIVNRVARPFYAEALRLYEEQVADPVTIDALMTEGGGFRMGPFELMDLIGHDVNYAVSLSVFEAFFQDPRFRPSNVQRELVNAGRLGRKTGRGFFGYSDGDTKPRATTAAPAPDAGVVESLVIGADTDFDGTRVVFTDGRRARGLAAAIGKPVIVHDLIAMAGTRLGFSASPDVTDGVVARFVATLAARGIAATRLPDWPGLVVMRTVAMLANEGFETVLQGVADEQSVDTAMRFGVNYPRGPIAWAREIGLARILAVLESIHALTGDPRYRPSFGLRMAVA